MNEQLNNPMRFAMHRRSIGLRDYPVDFTEIEIRPGEGNIYLFWE